VPAAGVSDQVGSPSWSPALHRERARRSRQRGAKKGHVRRPLLQTGSSR